MTCRIRSGSLNGEKRPYGWSWNWLGLALHMMPTSSSFSKKACSICSESPFSNCFRTRFSTLNRWFCSGIDAMYATDSRTDARPTAGRVNDETRSAAADARQTARRGAPTQGARPHTPEREREGGGGGHAPVRSPRIDRPREGTRRDPDPGPPTTKCKNTSEEVARLERTRATARGAGRTRAPARGAASVRGCHLSEDVRAGERVEDKKPLGRRARGDEVSVADGGDGLGRPAETIGYSSCEKTRSLRNASLLLHYEPRAKQQRCFV